MELLWVLFVLLLSQCNAKKVIIAVKKNIKELNPSQNVDVKLTAGYEVQNDQNATLNQEDLILNNSNRRTINLQNSFNSANNEHMITNTNVKPTLEDLHKIVHDVEKNTPGSSAKQRPEIVQILNVPAVYEMHLQSDDNSHGNEKLVLKSASNNQMVGHFMYIPPVNLIREQNNYRPPVDVAKRPYRTIVLEKNWPKYYKESNMKSNNHHQNVLKKQQPRQQQSQNFQVDPNEHTVQNMQYQNVLKEQQQSQNFQVQPNEHTAPNIQQQHVLKEQQQSQNFQLQPNEHIAQNTQYDHVATTTENILGFQNFDQSWFDINLQNPREKVLANKVFNEISDEVMYDKTNVHQNVYQTINSNNFDQSYPPSNYKVNKVDDDIIIGTPFNEMHHNNHLYEKQQQNFDHGDNRGMYSQHIDIFNMEKPQAIHEVPAPKLSPKPHNYRQPEGKVYMQTIYGKIPRESTYSTIYNQQQQQQQHQVNLQPNTNFDEIQNESGLFNEDLKEILYNLPTSAENIQIKVGGNVQFGNDHQTEAVNTASSTIVQNTEILDNNNNNGRIENLEQVLFNDNTKEENLGTALLPNNINMYYASKENHPEEKPTDLQNNYQMYNNENLDHNSYDSKNKYNFDYTNNNMQYKYIYPNKNYKPTYVDGNMKNNNMYYKNNYKIRNRSQEIPKMVNKRRNGPTNYVVYIREKSIDEYR